MTNRERANVVLALLGFALAPLIVLIATGTKPGDALLGLGYEVLLVAVPGLILYSLLLPGERDPICHLAIAWPLGIALELAVFNLTAATDTRSFMPFLLLAVCGIVLLRPAVRRTLAHTGSAVCRSIARRPTSEVAVLAGLMIAVLLVLVGEYFLTHPLPGSVAAVNYYPDVPFHLSLVAEASNHWPIQDPNIAGDGLHYHTFSHMHMAAVHQVTGVESATVLLRTFPVAPLIATILLTLALVRALGARMWIGLAAVALLFLAGELDFDGKNTSPFAGGFTSAFWLSPSLALAVPLFFAVLLLILRGWREDGPLISTRSLVVLILLCSLAGAKGAALPVLGSGIGLFIAWEAVRRRPIGRPAVRSLLLVGVAFVLSFALLYAGGPGLIELGGASFYESTIVAPPGDVTFVLPPLARVAISPVLFVLLLLSLAGIAWRLLGARPLQEGEKLLLALLAVGLLSVVVLASPGRSELYFLWFGFAAGVIVSATGIGELLGELRDRGALRLALSGGAIAAVVCVIGTLMTSLPVAPIREREYIAIGAILGATLFAVGLIAAFRSPGRRRLFLAGVVIPGALVASSFDNAVDALVPPLKRLPQPAYAVPPPGSPQGLTPGLNETLIWVRETTPTDAVLAVSNQQFANGVPGFVLYAALGERRTFIGGWQYSDRFVEEGLTAGDSILTRQADNLAVLSASTCEELDSALAAAPVDFALYDRVNSAVPEALQAIDAPAFENSDTAIYDLRAASADC